MGKIAGMGFGPCSRGRTLPAGAEGCQQKEECIGWHLGNLHAPGDRLYRPPLALLRLSCHSLDVCSAWLNQILLSPQKVHFGAGCQFTERRVTS